MDTDLFQLLALALLLFCLLGILAGLSLLNAIKKQLATTAALDMPTASQSGYAYDTPAASYEPVASYNEPATAQEVSTGFVSITEAAPAQAQPQTGASLTGGLRGDEPEEQPFERDGRWWFKRGGELLVYDEGTGQWVAPTGASAPAGATATTTATGTETQTLSRSDTGEGWKCSSCGAVNGSTATSCRMCFAPR
ncbi:MAG: zinc finger Ran-binding domain-containing protein [Actinobacteria bacterium]|nr:zinc finger Ran-binding domain-containing protein [Actinomycetota bacterium]